MTKHSLPHLNYALTINPWLHIRTAWKQKFRCSSEEVMEADIIDSVGALQAGHTRSTDNQIYRLSVQALAGAAEHVLPQYLEASTTWQHYCKAFEGGTLLHYKEAHSFNFKSSAKADIKQDQCKSMLTCAAVLSTQEIVQQVIAGLSPMLMTLVQDAVNNAMAAHKPDNHQTHTSGKGKEKETHQTSEDCHQWDQQDQEFFAFNSSNAEEDIGLKLALQQEAELNAAMDRQEQDM